MIACAEQKSALSALQFIDSFVASTPLKPICVSNVHGLMGQMHRTHKQKQMNISTELCMYESMMTYSIYTDAIAAAAPLHKSYGRFISPL